MIPHDVHLQIGSLVRRTVRLLQNGVYLEEAKLERRILHNMLKLLALPRGSNPCFHRESGITQLKRTVTNAGKRWISL